MASPSVIQWFAPPKLAHPELHQRARALWMLSWPFFAVVALLLGVAVLIEPETATRRGVTVAAVGALMAISHAISRGGRTSAASWTMVLGLSAVVTERAWVTGGIHAPVSVFYVLFIAMAGVLLGRRGAVVTAGACLLGAGALALGTQLQWTAAPAGAGPPLGAFLFVVLSIALAVVLQAAFTRRPRRDALDADAVYTVVGDMRSPMQTLLSRLEILRRHVTPEDADDVDAAIGGVRTLRRMTNCLLDVSRLATGRISVHRSVTNLSMLASDVVAVVRLIEPTCDIALESSGEVVCNCDPELTRRILENLVSNAMNVTRIDGRVRIAISASRERVRIAVSDEGPSVGEQRARLFEAYGPEQLSSGAGDESSALALVFCRLALQAQGGGMWIESGTPTGNVFIAELPRWGEGWTI